MKVILGDLNYRILVPELLRKEEEPLKRERAKQEVKRLIHV